MVGSFAFTSSARKLLKVGNFGKFLFPRKLGIAQACFALFQNRSPTSFDSISACIYPSSNLYSTLPPGGIVKSSYTVEIPDVSLNDYVLSKFNEYGDDLAMIDGASEKAYTYRELKSSIIKMGSALTKRGFKKGDVFALLLPNVPEYPIFFLGVAAVGGVVTTLNPMYSTKEIAFQLKDSGARYLVTTPAIAGTAREAATEAAIKEVFVTGDVDGCTPVSSLLDDNGVAFPENVQINPKEDACVIPYSSGTTGFPKGVMLTHHNLVSQLCLLKHDSFRAHPKRAVVLAFLPFFHIFGLVVVMVAFLERGGKIVSMIQFDGELMLELIQDYKVNALYIVPPVATFLAKHPLVEKYNFRSLDSVLSGAAPLGKELTELMKNRFPTLPVLGQGYGLTETSPAAMLCPRNICKPASVGVMLPNLEGKIVDVQTGETLGPNQDGEVCIRGPTVMKGYLNDPKTTAASITPDGWFHTGDIGHYDDDGHFFIVDRLKDLIKYKGFQVSPAELEALLHMHPNIFDVAVIGVPDSVAGEVPKAFVVPKGDITKEEVSNFVAERVASYKTLRGGVEFVAHIPKTASGKILKRELRKLT